MTNAQETVEFDKTLHDLNTALDVLTSTLSEGCEYPRLVAREIQALIIACMAHEKVKHATADERSTETPGRVLENPPQAAEMLRRMIRTLEARDSEVSKLRDLLENGINTIEAHTLTDSDGTAVLQGDYQSISAIEIQQWLDRARAEAAPKPARRSTKRTRRPASEPRDGLHAKHDTHQAEMTRGSIEHQAAEAATDDEKNDKQ